MTNLSGNVRGVGRSRGGATDTTMLIWKVIEANPGIDRAGIWERAENGIPEGYALRLYIRHGLQNPPRDTTRVDLARARGWVLTHALGKMRETGTVTWEGTGKERRYTVARKPAYVGAEGAIDVDGSKFAEHMAIADAWRTIRGMIARADPDQDPAFQGGRKEYEALVIAANAQAKSLNRS